MKRTLPWIIAAGLFCLLMAPYLHAATVARVACGSATDAGVSRG
jgi:hypothetical protein